jgi:Rap1a immunity proteins
MKTLCGMAVVGLVLLGTVASGAAEDGNTLLSKCLVAIQMEDPVRRRQATTQDAYDNGYCQGVIAGIIDRSDYLSISPAYRYCILPGGIFLSQAIRVVHRYLQAHPERLHLHHNDLVIEALHDAFPCAPAISRPQR